MGSYRFCVIDKRVGLVIAQTYVDFISFILASSTDVGISIFSLQLLCNACNIIVIILKGIRETVCLLFQFFQFFLRKCKKMECVSNFEDLGYYGTTRSMANKLLIPNTQQKQNYFILTDACVNALAPSVNKATGENFTNNRNGFKIEFGQWFKIVCFHWRDAMDG